MLTSNRAKLTFTKSQTIGVSRGSGAFVPSLAAAMPGSSPSATWVATPIVSRCTRSQPSPAIEGRMPAVTSTIAATVSASRRK
jgi:hypothetical protein